MIIKDITNRKKIDKELLHEIICSILTEDDFNEELKLKITQGVIQITVQTDHKRTRMANLTQKSQGTKNNTR